MPPNNKFSELLGPDGRPLQHRESGSRIFLPRPRSAKRFWRDVVPTSAIIFGGLGIAMETVWLKLGIGTILFGGIYALFCAWDELRRLKIAAQRTDAELQQVSFHTYAALVACGLAVALALYVGLTGLSTRDFANLAHLTNSQLAALTLEQVRQMREVAKDRENDESQATLEKLRIGPQTKEQLRQNFLQQIETENVLDNNEFELYRNKFNWNCLQLRDELKYRLHLRPEDDPHSNRYNAANVTPGVISMFLPEVADDLESMAKQLPKESFRQRSRDVFSGRP